MAEQRTVDRIEAWIEKVVGRFPSSRGVVAAIEVREGAPGHPTVVASLPYDSGDSASMAVELSDMLEILAGDRADNRRGASFSLVAVNDASPPLVLVGPFRVLVNAPGSGPSSELAPVVPAQLGRRGEGASQTYAEKQLVELLMDRLDASTAATSQAQKAASDVLTRALQGVETVISHVVRSHDAMVAALATERTRANAAEAQLIEAKAGLSQALELLDGATKVAEEMKQKAEKKPSAMERAKEAFFLDLMQRAAKRSGVSAFVGDDEEEPNGEGEGVQ